MNLDLIKDNKLNEEKIVSKKIKGERSYHLPGLYITFEGINGSGKTTIISLIYNKLENMGFQVVYILDQRATKLGKNLFKLYAEKTYKNEEISPLTELLLIAAARHQDVLNVIRPNLMKRKIVISERFNDALFAFQGFSRNISMDFIMAISEKITMGIRPDITILLDIDPKISLSRIRKKQNLNRFEKESLKFHEKVREGYLKLAEKDPKRINIINADKNPEKLLIEVENLITPLIKKKGDTLARI